MKWKKEKIFFLEYKNYRNSYFNMHIKYPCYDYDPLLSMTIVDKYALKKMECL